MTDCKDCFHKFVCTILENKGYQQDCKHFADRSRFVKPPCRVGDTVYVLDYDNAIDEFFTKKKNIVEERRVRRIEIHKNNEFRVFDTFAYGEPPKKIGETLFFTKEAAEQVLKKHEGND